MKCHDFGQFIFNSSVFDAEKLSEIIYETKEIQPTFSTTAFFLRLISAKELMKIFAKSKMIDEKNPAEIFQSHSEDIQKTFDEIVQKFLNPQKVQDLKEYQEDPSVKIAQVLIDGKMDLLHFEKILEEYHKIEISPVEKIFADWFSALPKRNSFDYPPAIEVIKDFHKFLSESLKTTIILSSTSDQTNENLFGASVKILGAVPIIVGIVAEKTILHKLASTYDEFVSEDIEEDFDSVAEMLNVFTGNFTVKMAALTGVEEELFPPMFGPLEEKDAVFLNVLCDFGNFYLYIGKEEIFKNI